uniref:Peptidase A1 domain-containing protein n=1 Tax=Chromera velia CCMP2878 TaxID=1169474 RepID=A0A0G4I4H6_9ALVE|eukprot:Cvel_1806.t1-p1 / transcript=Cvel_1806.t1 / gene=Cvel_1806 / organism=Chromera_velia_CCMP2878 / gene_product=hypothetical protein / transcript_product=hypothetical protein / location=Cvel_scaffold66:98231-101536(-) / protein_length=457 / sequence_SO=supercontig / SO=protein_coding / is_pseudo=false
MKAFLTVAAVSSLCICRVAAKEPKRLIRVELQSTAGDSEETEEEEEMPTQNAFLEGVREDVTLFRNEQVNQLHRSALTWVPSDESCAALNASSKPSCKKRTFKKSESSTARDLETPFSVVYAGTSVTGAWVEDVLQLGSGETGETGGEGEGGLQVNKFTVGVVDDISKLGPSYEASPFDGGVGERRRGDRVRKRLDEGVHGGSPYSSKMKVIDAPVFSLAFNFAKGKGKGKAKKGTGALFFGSDAPAEASRAVGGDGIEGFVWLPTIAGEPYWSLYIRKVSWQVSGPSSPASSSPVSKAEDVKPSFLQVRKKASTEGGEKKGRKVIVDSGLSCITGPSEEVRALMSSKALPFESRRLQNGAWVADCSDIIKAQKQLQGLSVELVGGDSDTTMTLDVPLSNLYYKIGVDPFRLTVSCEIRIRESKEDSWGLGLCAIERLATAFDAQSTQSRIGFYKKN